MSFLYNFDNIYVLLSKKDGKLYVGQTDNLRRRFQEHQLGKVSAIKHRRPLILCFYEAFLNKQDAIRREQYFKTGKGRSSLKQITRHSINGRVVER